jgi:signal transduction histidine kinase
VHEIGRPLGAIRSGIQSLLRGADQDQQLMRELVKGMDDEADRMQHVLDELAHLHDEVIGTLELEKEFLILDQWLPKVLLPWKQSADEKGIHWNEEYPDTPIQISVDPIRMGQVIGNLASNSVRYTPFGGSVSISTGTTDTQAWIRFIDTGLGIAEEEQELVFEPFYRGDQGRKIRQGMGLGLSIAREILHAHGGEIELRSNQNVGSQFTIWLPNSKSQN